MKIIHIIENLDDTYGGPAKSVPYLAKGLDGLGIEQTLVSIKYHENESNEVISKNDLVWLAFSYDYIKKIRYSKELKNYLIGVCENKKGLILHIHNLWNYIPFISYTIAKRFKIPYVVAIRGSLYPWSLQQGKIQKKIAWNLFQKNALNCASCIHVTDIEELKAVRNLGITSPIALVPNGINLDEFNNMNNKQISKQNLKLEKDKKYILFLSRVHPKKGLEFLVQAWSDLAKKNKNWDLLIVGPIYDEKYYQNIKQLLVRCELDSRVYFKGMINGQDRIDAYSASDLFVLPSHSENFGIAIAEAMAAKLPVITTQGTPWKEIQEYDAGWWSELNLENITKSLQEALASSEGELKQKGLNGFELIKKYEWKYQAQKMKQVYTWILDNGERPKFVYEIGEKI